MNTESFDPYHRWLGIPPKDQPPDHYRLLGIERFESDAEVIRDAADRQMAHVRTYQLAEYSTLSQRVLNELAAARVCLLKPENKAAYDEQLRARLGGNAPPTSLRDPTAAANIAPAVFEEGLPESERNLTADSEAKLDILTPLFLGISAGMALSLLGVLIWWVALRGGGPERAVKPPLEMAERDMRGPPVPPVPPPPPESSRPTVLPAGEDDGEVYQLEITEKVADELIDEAHGPTLPEVDDRKGEDVLGDTESPSMPEEVKREPVPGASQQQAMREVLEETFDTVATRTSEEQQALANKLTALAEKAEDPTEQFVLLRRASELASEAGDAARVLQLIDRIAVQFEVDGLLAQAVMLGNVANHATREEQIGSLVERSAGVIDEALAADRFDLAVRLAESVHLACRSPAGSAFRVDALTRRREVEQLRDRWKQVQAARDALGSNPDDETAHTVIGQWYAVVRDDWDRALPHFAKGSDADLKLLANGELQTPPGDADAQVKLADAWWDLAENSGEQAEQAFRRRAAHWYKEAEPQLSSPLLKSKVEKRLGDLREVRQSGPKRPQLPARVIVISDNPKDLGRIMPEDHRPYTFTHFPSIPSRAILSQQGVLIILGGGYRSKLRFSNEDVQRVIAFVESGGGMLCAGHAWSWVHSGRKPIEEFPLNLLGAHFGFRLGMNIGRAHSDSPDVEVFGEARDWSRSGPPSVIRIDNESMRPLLQDARGRIAAIKGTRGTGRLVVLGCTGMLTSNRDVLIPVLDYLTGKK